MLKKLLIVITICFIAILGSTQLFAQETTSEIQGTVTDKGTGVSSAVVTAIHTPTGTRYVTTTRKDGRFNLPNLKVGGPYTIIITHVGFKEEKTEGVFLVLGQEYKADYTLIEESKQLSEIVVTSSRQNTVFNNSRNGSQEIISRAQLERLPTINRSIQDFVKLEPSANGLNIGGRSSQYNNMTVDGANFNNSFGLSSLLGGQTNSQPISLEAIDQIQVNISPYDVTAGGFSGTGINTVTKSGSNTFRGTVYTYIKNQDFQGYKVGNATVTKTNFDYYIRGASLGGPIVKNKLFFFVSAEMVRQSAPATSVTASDATHVPGGAVSQANADTLNALSAFLKQKYNYDPGAFQGYNFLTSSDKITAKIDWNINLRNTFTLKYNYLKSNADQFASASRPGVGQITGGQPGTFAMPFFGSGYVINNNFNIFIAELNTRFSNKVSNKIQVGYTALRDFRSPHSSSTSFPLVDILNGGNIYTTFGYEPFTYNNILNTDVYQFSDIFKFYKGSHEITIGTQDYYRKYQNAFAPGYQGVYQFNSLTDFYNSANNGVANARSYYLQYSALPKGEFPFAFAGSTELGLFVQDKWRASKKFTLTYGLRVDYTIYKEAFTDNPYFDALTFKDGAKYNIGKAPTNVPLISPRVGFNWDVVGDKSLQIRGGFGIFSGPPPFVWISNQASNNGIQFGSFTSAANTRAFSQDPNAYRPTAGASLPSYSVALVDNNFKYPTVLKTNIAADKRLGGDWILTVEAALSKDINAVYYSNINLNESNGFALTGVDNRLRYLTVTNSNKYYYGTTLANPNLGNAILMKNTSKGFGFVGTARVQKNYKNFTGGLSYTYSLAMNSAEFGSTASSLWSAVAVGKQDPNAANIGLASYYQPHRFLANFSYKVDYFKNYSTSFGFIAEVTNNGAGSFVYNGDMNGDGNTGNDLIYIPKNLSDINLVKVGSGGSGAGASTDPRTIATIWNQLNDFIQTNPYLKNHRGQYAERNANVSPFYCKIDLNVTQDLSIRTGNTKHTLRVSLDLVNATNLLNKNWGMVKIPAVSNFLRYEGLTSGNQPSFSFPFLTGNTPFTKSFINSTGIASRWVMQLGVRYMLN
jgi:Carboxypeptidase regulatory-like domain